jgi:hypothetical protein
LDTHSVYLQDAPTLHKQPIHLLFHLSNNLLTETLGMLLVWLKALLNW